MNPGFPIIPKSKLKFWYQKGYVVPLAFSIKSEFDPWQIAKLILEKNPHAFFLDSVRYQEKTGSYSYLGWKPFRIFKAANSAGIILKLRNLLSPYQGRKWNELPFFTGGAVGYFSYALAHAFESLPDFASDDLCLDSVSLLLVRDLLVFDHKEDMYYLISNLIPSRDGSFEQAFQRAEKAIEEMRLLLAMLSGGFVSVIARSEATKRSRSTEIASPPAGVRNDVGGQAITSNGHSNGRVQIRNFQSDISKQKFKQMIKKAKKYIERGDIYQANLSQRFSFDVSGQAETIYETLRTINPSPFSSFLKIGPLTVASVSPERLIKLNGRVCETRPIAGTKPRGGTPEADQSFRRELLMSPKERAEHIMLVDLERNDLGRVSEPRSVRVNEFMTLEPYSHVVHIVSNISGRLKKECDRFDLIKAVFPGGTITGCPKIRSMEIIEELEPFKRHLYTGSIGYLDFNGDLDLNIVIRSLILKGNKGYLQVGAGIVYDSDPESEYWETLHKGKALIDALSAHA